MDILHRMVNKSTLQLVYTALRDGPRFPSKIDAPSPGHGYWAWFKEGKLARSARQHRIIVGTRHHDSYAYADPSAAGQTLTWKYDGNNFTDSFELSKLRPIGPKGPGISFSPLQDGIINILRTDGALFSEEVFNRIKPIRPTTKLQQVRAANWKLLKRGRIIQFDDARGGHKFRKGFLLALPADEAAFGKRIESLDDTVVRPLERAILNHSRSSIRLGREMRDRTGVDESLLTFIIRKFGKEAPLNAKEEGKGRQFRITVEIDGKKSLQGRGLIPWLRWFHLFGNLVIYDSGVPETELIKFIKEKGYWLSEEGRRRQQIGFEFERYSDELFNLIDSKKEWNLNVVEHRTRWRSMPGPGQAPREFDHIYRCVLGPQELAISTYLIFECKAGLITSENVDEFYRAVSNDPEFRNLQSGGHKANVILVMLTAKTAEPLAFKKATRLGIHIILNASMADVKGRLTGERETFYKRAAKIQVIRK